jgi:hypothetical protein
MIAASAAPPQPAAAAAVPYRSSDYVNAGSDFQGIHYLILPLLYSIIHYT